MTSHTHCTHPSTPADRAACRKLRAKGIDTPPSPLVVAAPRVQWNDSSVAHMTEYQARVAVRNLLDAHGLAGQWSVTFDNARRRAGLCNYTLRRISLSAPLMRQRTYAETMTTITHEVAHALTPGHKHDHVWAAKHRELGGDGKRCFAHFDEDAPWVGTCEHGQQFAKYRQPKRLHGWSCRCPQGKSTITWERNV